MGHENELADLDLEQRRLEVDKLRAEVDQARLAWWKRPGYLGGMTPIVLAMVGLVTAWANGYFDTQRAQLANEIGVLQAEKDALDAKIADAQRAIDYGYLQARLAAYDTDYAIGHFEAFSQQTDAVMAPLSKVLDSVATPDAMKAPVRELVEVLEMQQNIGEITKDAVSQVLSQLSQIDATPWVKELATDPMLSAERRFRAPDGRVFDVAAWDWIDG